MADDTPNGRDVPPDLSRLADRLADDTSSSSGNVRSDRGARGKAFGGALKVSSEMIAGIALGGGAGWLLDDWLDTSPTLLIICVGLGFAAGLRNVFRTAQGFSRRQPDQEQNPPPQDPPSGT